jgi:hypothetical protein
MAKETILEAVVNRNYSFSEFCESKSTLLKNANRLRFNVFIDQHTFDFGQHLKEKFKGIKIDLRRGGFEKITFDFKLAIDESFGRPLLIFIYNNNLFSPWQREKFSRNFKKILKQIVRNPFVKIGDLKIEK